MRHIGEAEYAEYVQARMGWLRRTAYLLCQDWQGADDLVQATFTSLYTHWARARRMTSLDGYTRTILVNAFLSEKRTGWSRRVVLPGAPGERAALATDHDMNMDVKAALGSVPPRQRATIVLRFYCDLSVEEAASILGVSPGTVKSQTAKGLAAMRSALAPTMKGQA